MNTLIMMVMNGWHRTVRTLTSAQAWVLLGLRLDFGYQFFQSGLGKLHRLPQVAEFFGTLGIPFPAANALFVALTECVGGALLAAGVGTRAVAFLLLMDMSVAYATADREALSQFFTDPGKFSAADPFTFWLASLLLLVFGPGWVAVDRLIARCVRVKATSDARAVYHA